MLRIKQALARGHQRAQNPPMRGIFAAWFGSSLAALALAAAATAAPMRPPLANLGELPQPHGGKLILGPEGRSLYVNAGDRLLTYARDPHSSRLDLISDSETAGSTVLSPDGRFAYTAAQPYGIDPARLEVLSRDTATGLLTHQQTVASGGAIVTMVISPDGRDLYALPPNDPAVLHFRRDPASGSVALGGEVKLDEQVARGLALKLAPDGRELFVAGLNHGARLRRDISTGAVAPVADPPENKSAFKWQFDLAVSADGRRFYTGGGRFNVSARDPESGELTGLTVERPPCDRDFIVACLNGIVQPSPDGQLVAALASDEYRMGLFQTGPDGARHLRDWSLGADGIDSMMSVSGIEWTPDSRALYVAGASLGLWVRDGDGLRFAGEGQLPRPSDPPTRPSLEILNEPKYVKSSRVTLDVAHPKGATSLLLANEAAMSGVRALRFPANRRVTWRLRPGRRGRATVYARYLTRPGAKGLVRDVQAYSVTVDGAAPGIQRAALRSARGAKRSPARLLLRARDARSGVNRVQVTTKRSRPGKARRYARRVPVRGRPRRVWVRVIDRAGNKSRWKRVRRR